MAAQLNAKTASRVYHSAGASSREFFLPVPTRRSASQVHHTATWMVERTASIKARCTARGCPWQALLDTLDAYAGLDAVSLTIDVRSDDTN